jgi:hypothetical protein
MIKTRSRFSPTSLTKAFDTYWKFAAERQEVFFRRFEEKSPPWTDDPIISKHKFTNAYRASDRVSQYLIKNVIYKGPKEPEEVFFRIILFKIFNKIETWKLLENELNGIFFAEYSFEKYDKVLTAAMEQGNAIYSAAYIMPSVPSLKQAKKHRNHLCLIEIMMKDEIAFRLQEAKSLKTAFEIILKYPGMGKFLAYQYVIDINYSELINFSEMEFVVPGPGALDGIAKCFNNLNGLTEAEIIKVMADSQEDEFNRLGIKFKSLWGRPLQLIDCQNLFCEVDKYSRIFHPDIKGISGRSRIKQVLKVNNKPIDFWYPPKWRINELIHPEIKK